MYIQGYAVVRSKEINENDYQPKKFDNEDYDKYCLKEKEFQAAMNAVAQGTQKEVHQFLEIFVEDMEKKIKNGGYSNQSGSIKLWSPADGTSTRVNDGSNPLELLVKNLRDNKNLLPPEIKTEMLDCVNLYINDQAPNFAADDKNFLRRSTIANRANYFGISLQSEFNRYSTKT